MTTDALKQIREHLKGQGLLDSRLVSHILKTTAEALKREPNLVEVRCADAVIIGDIHGQFYDLLNILERVCADKPPEGTTSYVFLGDYVDRGSFSTECVLYLSSLKLLCPRNVFLLRGNHESEKLNKNFNFLEEFTQKYSLELFSICQHMFNSMPLCAVVNNKYFCAHGGISPEAKILADINKIKRHREIPQEGTMTDLLWSDPCDDYEDNDSTRSSDMFQFNQQRQTSYRYNHAAIRRFLSKNKLTSVIRGHEVQLTGVKLFKHKEDKFPSVITVFSAPNYIDSYKNKGAVIVISEKDMDLRSFNAVDHPFLLPEGLNAFTWSLPFVGEKINEMLVNMLNVCTEEELNQDDDEQQPQQPVEGGSPKHLSAERKEVVRNKIKAVARMGTYYKTLQMEHDAIMKLKVLSPGGRLAPGLLSGGRSSIMSALEKNENLNFDHNFIKHNNNPKEKYSFKEKHSHILFKCEASLSQKIQF